MSRLRFSQVEALSVLPTIKLCELTLRNDIDDNGTDTLLIVRNTESYKDGDGNVNEIVMNVHSGVLRVASSVFMRGFDGLKPRDIRGTDGEVQQKLIYRLFTPHPQAVQRIVYYIYKNDYHNVNEDPRLLVPIYQESSRLGIKELKNSVLRIIRSQNNLETIAALSRAADLIGEVELSRDCGRVLADSAYAVFSAKLLQRMGPSGIKSMLELDNVQLDEVQIFTVLCHFFGSNFNYISPYSSSSISAKEKEFLKCIRFCSMSPKCIDQLRHENLNSLLLDATLRLLQGNHRKPRHVPWTANMDYTCVTYNGLFPVLVVRGQKSSIASFDPNSGNKKLVTPLLKKETCDPPSWAFTVGTEREFSLSTWSYEVARSKNGNVALGVVFSSSDPVDEASRAQFNSMGRNRRIVLFYDFTEDNFKSGYVIPGLNRQIKALWTYESSSRKSPYKLSQREIVTVTVAVSVGGISLTIALIGTQMKREFQLPHRSNGTLGSVIKKPCILGAPFVILHDIGDSLSIPELRAEFKL